MITIINDDEDVDAVLVTNGSAVVKVKEEMLLCGWWSYD